MLRKPNNYGAGGEVRRMRRILIIAWELSRGENALSSYGHLIIGYVVQPLLYSLINVMTSNLNQQMADTPLLHRSGDWRTLLNIGQILFV